MALLAPSTPICTQAADALATLLGGITLAEADPLAPTLRRFHYVPGEVLRPPYFSEEWLAQDLAEDEVTYHVLAGTQTMAEETTHQYDITLELWVFGGYRYRYATTNPADEDPKRIDISENMIQDVQRRVLEDGNWTLGDIAQNTEARNFERGWLDSGWCTMMGLFEALISVRVNQ